jgi:hypothetical protein
VSGDDEARGVERRRWQWHGNRRWGAVGGKESKAGEEKQIEGEKSARTRAHTLAFTCTYSGTSLTMY